MDFDPLELFTAAPSAFKSEPPENHSTVKPSKAVADAPLDADFTQADEEFVPLDVHDLPLLQCKPPIEVLSLILKLLAPEAKRNFDPSSERSKDFVPAEIFVEKDVTNLISRSLPWLTQFCPRFNSSSQLASIALLSSSLKANYTSQYNAWLTRIISHDLSWIAHEESETVKKLASLRLAENCGRTAQPELIRQIEIPSLSRKISLKEPSLTSDNLGLKTWGSSFILGCRLARDAKNLDGATVHDQAEKPALSSSYLHGSVLELGAGTGLVGMVSCILGYHTTLTDLHEITPNLRDNIILNSVENAVVSDLDWTAPESFVEDYPNAKFSTIILSDPLYSSEHHVLIVNMINMFLKKDSSSRVLIQIPQRGNYEKERAALWQLMEDNGYTASEEIIESGFDDFGQSSFIFKKYVHKSSG